MRLVEYVRKDGSSPFRAWFEGLDSQATTKVAVATLRLESGNTSSIKAIGKIAEYRIDWGPGYRVYLGRDGAELIILLGGGTKRHQDRDIARAAMLFAEYKARKAEAAKGKSKR